MEQFQAKFIEEATDLIDDLEELMLETQVDNLAEGFIEQVFRIMHSLKGSGAMFGFQNIGNFAHNLEDLYDSIRTGRLAISESILDLTLASVDLFKQMLADNDKISDTSHERIVEINSSISDVLEGKSKTDSKAYSLKHDKKLTSYWIQFWPNADILDNGTNPLFVVDELCSLGKATVIADLTKLPDLPELELEKSYIRWYIILATESAKEDLDEVFMFVEDSAKIEITTLGPKNIFNNDKAVQLIDYARKHPATIGVEFTTELKQCMVEEISESIEAIRNNLNDFNKRKHISSIRVASEKIDSYLSNVSELVTVQTSLSILAEKLKDEELSRLAEEIEHLTRNLRDNAISISLVPFATVVSRFQRLVRDLSKEFKKEIELKAEGMETELDKTMIQTITDPLMHILRNSIDHGIESPSERVSRGKARIGLITMHAYHSGANIVIEVSDDGRGINPKSVEDTAIKRGLIAPGTQLKYEDLVKMILKPGFSTTEHATSVSGRGVGMDVVNQNVNSLKGSLDIISEPGKGTTIRIKLPQSLSILDGMLVNIGDTLFIIPSMVLLKIIPIEYASLLKNKNNMIYIDSEHIPFINLRKEFDIKGTPPEHVELVLLEYEGTKVALIVDQVHNEYQVVLRPLGKFLKNNDMLLGASIIGEGNISLVLDTNRIIKRVATDYQSVK